MYKISKSHQVSFSDFNQPMGFKLNPENRWVKRAEIIPWEQIEKRYVKLFPSNKGTVAKPLRMALGALLIQKWMGYSDLELIESIRENPYLQYFIGLSEATDEAPFVPSLLVEFRKRLTDEVIMELNEVTIESIHQNQVSKQYKENEKDKDKSPDDRNNNSGTMILDATCAPQNIAYPQDINLLNEARENLEDCIDTICEDHKDIEKPRMYRKKARKDYLELAKCRKRNKKKIRKAIKKQLQYITRDLGYISKFQAMGIVIRRWYLKRIEVIKKVLEQQKYMYKHCINRVDDRIVSLSQDYIRPIVRGKARSKVEFGAKFDMSVDERGICRSESFSFDAYNEGDTLISAIERYKNRTSHYPERVLVDTIYRSRENRKYCKERGIRISGPALGRPRQQLSKEERKQSYQDSVDRIEVERDFGLCKRCFGLGLITTKLADTTKGSIALSIYIMNINHLMRVYFYQIFGSIFFKIVNKIKEGIFQKIVTFFSVPSIE